MSADDVQCRCCGVFVSPDRRAVRRCQVCDMCDRLHGDELQLSVARFIAEGRLDPYHALARMLVDDAHMAGDLSFVPEVDLLGRATSLSLWVLRPPERWMVVVGRAVAMGEAPDISVVLAVILARYIPGRCSRVTLDAIARDLTAAMSMIDDNVVSVEVDSRRDVLDPEHLIITVSTRTAAAPGMLALVDQDVDLPSDIMTRPRGQA